MKSFLAIILILASVGFFFLKINPNYSEIKILKAQGAQYDEALRVAEELKKIRVELASKLSSFSQEELTKLDHFMPEQLDTVRIILDVDGIAASHGIKLKDIKVNDGAKVTTPNQTQTPYNTTALSFLFNTSYGNAQDFIEDIEKSLRLADIVNVTVKPPAEKTSGYDFGITLNTYWIGKK